MRKKREYNDSDLALYSRASKRLNFRLEIRNFQIYAFWFDCLHACLLSIMPTCFFSIDKKTNLVSPSEMVCQIRATANKCTVWFNLGGSINLHHFRFSLLKPTSKSWFIKMHCSCNWFINENGWLNAAFFNWHCCCFMLNLRMQASQNWSNGYDGFSPRNQQKH